MLGLWRIRSLSEQVRRRFLFAQAKRRITSFPVSRPVASKSGIPTELIVSLTSYPPRFAMLAATLKGILSQTVQQDRTILWVAEKDFPLVPREVRSLEQHGLEVRRCDDLRSYKKLIPALAAFPAATIVTADDDVYYGPDWLDGLVGTSINQSARITCWRAHLARFLPSGACEPYRSFEMNTSATSATTPDTALFPTGIGGVLYEPRSLHPSVMDDTAFMTLCPHADDVWFLWMGRMAGVEPKRCSRPFNQMEWPDTQQVALYHENLGGGRNDVQIRAMERTYGVLKSIGPGH